MSKIICDICGTSYQDTAECCPICGCSKDSAADFLAEETAMQEAAGETTAKTGRTASKKAIFDYDEANSQRRKAAAEEVEEYDEEDEAEEEEPRQNTFVVILLTILIFAMLVAAGFIFVRYFLPNMGDKDETKPVVTEPQQVQTDATQLRIACETLVLNSGSQADLAGVGFSHLINVLVVPEDTTDTLTFLSADESIATVSADGKITAVAEGETIVTITCGNVQAYVNVVCDFTPETEPTAEATEAAEETKAEEAEDITEQTTEATEADKKVDANVVLKLKKTDIRLGVYYQFTLELDCDLSPEDVEWSSEHPHIAKVDEKGVVTAVQAGTTGIYAKYGDQKVQCIVRCF